MVAQATLETVRGRSPEQTAGEFGRLPRLRTGRPIGQNIICPTSQYDIFTREDAEFLVRNQALPPERIRAVETGGCPHAAIREDISHNLLALEQLMEEVHPELLFVESGGDNLAAQYSRAARASPNRSCW